MKSVNIVVPATRKATTQRLIESLSLGSVHDISVLVVSNEIDRLDPMGLDVRILRYWSTQYAVGYQDVTLRCNIGLYESLADITLISGDDQIASRNTISDFIHKLDSVDHIWGHHRYTTFYDKSVASIVAMPASQGRSRETSPNRYHGYYSCYSGALGGRTQFLQRSGGFDMVFNCRHSGEDQQLGLRLNGRQVFIHEPPFWWHPEERDDWGVAPSSNVCSEHIMSPLVTPSGLAMKRCTRCPYTEVADSNSKLFNGDLHIPYDRELVTVNEERQFA